MFALQVISSGLVHNQTPANINVLIHQICKEADRLKSRCPKGQQTAGGKKDSPTDKALAATASKDGKRKRRKGKCHNCGKQGHWAQECHSPKKDKEEGTGTKTVQASTASTSTSTSSKPDNKPVSSANVIYDMEGDSFWIATEEAADRIHLASAEPNPLLGEPNVIVNTLHWEGEEIVSSEEEWIGAVITLADEDHRICVELYDSGATRHISPYKSDFMTYSPLAPPIYLNTTNQQRFPAIGHGTLVVQIPNGNTETEITLHGVLHAPAVSCTLVLVATLDAEGYHAHMGDGHLELTSPNGKCIGRVHQQNIKPLDIA